MIDLERNWLSLLSERNTPETKMFSNTKEKNITHSQFLSPAKTKNYYVHVQT